MRPRTCPGPIEVRWLTLAPHPRAASRLDPAGRRSPGPAAGRNAHETRREARPTPACPAHRPEPEPPAALAPLVPDHRGRPDRADRALLRARLGSVWGLGVFRRCG